MCGREEGTRDNASMTKMGSNPKQGFLEENFTLTFIFPILENLNLKCVPIKIGIIYLILITLTHLNCYLKHFSLFTILLSIFIHVSWSTPIDNLRTISNYAEESLWRFCFS
jgi:hypothetical protein